MSDVSIPILPSRDLAETRSFYERLGFEAAGWWPDTFGGYAIMRKGDLSMHFFKFPELSPGENYAQCYWRVVDVDAFYDDIARAKLPSHGIPRVSEPEDRPWGMREFALNDPNGNLVRIGQQIRPAPRT